MVIDYRVSIKAVTVALDASVWSFDVNHEIRQMTLKRAISVLGI